MSKLIDNTVDYIVDELCGRFEVSEKTAILALEEALQNNELCEQIIEKAGREIPNV